MWRPAPRRGVRESYGAHGAAGPGWPRRHRRGASVRPDVQDGSNLREVLVAGTATALEPAGRERPAGLVCLSATRHNSLRPGHGRLVLADQLHPEDVPHELLPDALGELLEHVEGLPPVLGEGVALAVRSEVDALLAVV